MKKEVKNMPEASFTITGNIQDFTRLDNLYAALKRESDKLLTTWEIAIEVKYSEKQVTTPE